MLWTNSIKKENTHYDNVHKTIPVFITFLFDHCNIRPSRLRKQGSCWACAKICYTGSRATKSIEHVKTGTEGRGGGKLLFKESELLAWIDAYV
jgi:hypothetical protein